jgi:hypothetical protein
MSRPKGSKNRPKGNPNWGHKKEEDSLYIDIDGYKEQKPKETIQLRPTVIEPETKKSKRAKPDRLLYVLCSDKTWHTIQENALDSWIKDGSIKEGDMILLPRVIKIAKNQMQLINKE